MLIPFGVLSAAGAGDLEPVFPSGITGLVARYDAADLTSISVSGSDVTQWNDLSGNGHNATQGTSTNRPKSGTRTLNSKNVLDFDGTNDFLINNGIAASYTGTSKPFTIFQVTQLDTTAGNQTSWSIANSSAGNPRIFPTNEQIIIRNNSGTEVGPSITGAYNTNSQFLTYRSSGTNFTGFINKTLILTSAYSLGSRSLNVASIGTYRGFNFASGVQFWNGVIGEMIYYDRELTTSEVGQVHDYLSDKWGI
jgi:hypothetical protein